MGTSQSGWDRLGQDRIYHASHASAQIAGSLQAAANALYEAILGAGAPGSDEIFIEPHNHGTKGGVSLARGSHWTFEGCDGLSMPLATDPAGWKWLDRDGEDRSFVATNTTPSTMMPDIPWGMDTANTAVGGAATALEGRVRAYLPAAGGNSKVDFKFYNATTNTYSSTVAATSWSSVNVLSFVDVPIKEGQRNEIILLMLPDVAAVTVSMLSINLCSTRSRGQAESPGSSDIENTTKP